MRAVLRDTDVVSRLSGDEFAVLLTDLDRDDEPVEIARRLTAQCEQPFRLEGVEVRVTMSIGVVTATGRSLRADELLRAADGAMYDAKQRGRNQVSAQRLTGPVQGDALSLPAELLAAVGVPPGAPDAQLQLYLQPIVDVTDARPVAAEALVRWQHPRLGLLAPGAFLPVAEEHGLVAALDRWMLVAACRWAGQAVATAAPGEPPPRISVNLSSGSLADPDLVAHVREALRDHGCPAELLVVEVVESRALLDVAGIRERLQAIRRLGVRVALDDFGTGYSTLSWLHTLPVDTLKIDRSFTCEADVNERTVALLRGVTRLATELGLTVVAEGVETAPQLGAVRAAGIRFVQGYLLGRPAPA
jgi:EAL domain-containing protein (putative c-di-GMP-specific phosphodiesterase class I)